MKRRDLLRLGTALLPVGLARRAAGALIPPFFFDCVVAIGERPLVEEKTPDGKTRGKRGGFDPAASGFLYADFIEKVDEEQKRYRIYLVTNKHVIQGVEQRETQRISEFVSKGLVGKEELVPVAYLRFNAPKNAPAQDNIETVLRRRDGGSDWLVHSEVDVAIAPVSPEFLQKGSVEFGVFRSDQIVADRSKAKELGISEGDGVFVLGFPMGLVGEGRNYVIAREGAIARIRDTLAGTTNEFLVDAFVFPGNSGGPVVLRPEAISIKGTKSQPSTWLIGIVKGYVPYRDVAVSQQTRRPRVVFEENSGLASVIPIDFVKELVEEHKKGARTP